MRIAAVVLWLTVGCDVVFQIEPLYVPMYDGHVINDPDGDVDGDGTPNALDLCVLIPDTEIGGRIDTDGDGVGDLCDPDPNTGGNCLALFDTFAAPTLSQRWRFEGESVTDVDDKLHIESGTETFVYLDTPLDLDALFVEGYVYIGANAGGDRHSLQLFFDAKREPLITGQACSVESDSQRSQVAMVDVVNGIDTIGDMAPLDSTLIGAGTSFELSWNRDGCHGLLVSDSTDIAATVAAVPRPGGTFAFRVLDAGVDLYTVVGYGRGCND